MSTLQTALDIVRMCGTKQASVAELKGGLSSLSVEAAEAEVMRLERELQEQLLDLDDKAVAAAERKIEAAALEVRRTARAIEALERQIADVEQAEDEVSKRALYAEAERKAKAAADVLQKNYAKHTSALISIVRALAEAGDLVAKANARLPAGAEALVHPEAMVRLVPPQPREIISEETVTRWCFPETGNPVGNQDAVDDRGNGDGMLGVMPNHRRVVLRRFKEVTYYAATQRRWADPLADVINLPALRAGGVPVWTAGKFNGSRGVLIRLNQLEAARAEKETGEARPIESELVLLDDEPDVATPIPAAEEQERRASEGEALGRSAATRDEAYARAHRSRRSGAA